MHGTSCALLIVQLGSLMRFDRKRRTSRISQSQGKFFLLTPAIVTLCGLGGDLHPLFNLHPFFLSPSINCWLGCKIHSTAVPFISSWGKEPFYHKDFRGTQKLTWCQQFGVQHPSKWEYPKSCPSFWVSLGLSFGQNSTSRPNGQFLPIAKLMFERSIWNILED